HCFTNIIVDDYLMYTSQKTVGLYNQPLLLPKKLKTMKIADDYVKSIDGYIPSTVTCLILSHYFKEPLNDIPSSITHLTFGAHFNSYLTLSSTITHLKFGHHFDQKIINFPPNLVSLTFVNLFNQEIDNLPSTVIRLILGSNFNKSIKNIPISVTHLEFNSDHECYENMFNELSSTVTYLHLGD